MTWLCTNLRISWRFSVCGGKYRHNRLKLGDVYPFQRYLRNTNDCHPVIGRRTMSYIVVKKSTVDCAVRRGLKVSWNFARKDQETQNISHYNSETRFSIYMCSRHVQPLLRNGWTCRVVRVLPHTKSANTACKTLLMMDR